MKSTTDISGKVYGKLTVLSFAGNSIHNKPSWNCLCECGNTKVIIGAAMKNGKTTSCGCFHKKQLSSLRKTHGLSASPEYSIWAGMLNRCKNNSQRCFKHYGGKGIKVCPEWYDFSTFLLDMGNRPSAHHSIERLNGNLAYSKDNCVWASAKQQANNRINVRKFTHLGEEKTIGEWAEYLGIPHSKLYYRLVTAGQSIEQTLKL
jgi:hypothetical protein